MAFHNGYARVAHLYDVFDTKENIGEGDEILVVEAVKRGLGD
jgi:hypothetical protein